MKKHPVRFSIYRVARFSLLLYVCLFAWGWFSADRMAFFPPAPSYAANEEGIFFVDVGNGERVAVLQMTHPDPDWVVLYAHGNAEDIGQLRFLFEAYRELGVSIYAVDYRGYGRSDGRAGIQNAKEDVRAVYRHLVEEVGIDPGRILLHGRSLGTAMVLPLAASEPVGGILLESAMVNGFRTMIPWPIFPLDPIPNNRHIRNISAPVHFLHGEDDAVIPLWHGQKLYALAPEPKSADWIPGVGHNDLVFAGDAYWNSVRAFLEAL